MLVATMLGVLLIPMLYEMVEKLIGGAKKPTGTPMPAAAGHAALAAPQGHGGR